MHHATSISIKPVVVRMHSHRHAQPDSHTRNMRDMGWNIALEEHAMKHEMRLKASGQQLDDGITRCTPKSTHMRLLQTVVHDRLYRNSMLHGTRTPWKTRCAGTAGLTRVVLDSVAEHLCRLGLALHRTDGHRSVVFRTGGHVALWPKPCFAQPCTPNRLIGAH